MTAILFTSSLAGFIFAKYKFPFRGVFFAIILATAIIPLEVYVIPLYLMVFGVKMMNSYFVVGVSVRHHDLRRLLHAPGHHVDPGRIAGSGASRRRE